MLILDIDGRLAPYASGGADHEPGGAGVTNVAPGSQPRRLVIRPGNLDTRIIQARRRAKDRAGHIEIDLTRVICGRMPVGGHPVLNRRIRLQHPGKDRLP